MKHLVLIGVSVAVAGLIAAVGPSAAASSGSTGTSQADAGGCTQHSPVTEVDTSSPIAAIADLVDSTEPLIQNWDYDGTKVFQRIPPVQWNPLLATPLELAYYGIPPRPVSPDDLMQWIDDWGPAHFSGIAELSFICSGNPGSLRYGSSSGGIWAGVVDNGVGDYTQAYAGVTEPYTSDPCPSGVAIYDAWAGLGGWRGSGNLLQAGVVVGDPNAPGSAGGDVAFWQAVNATAPINAQFLPNNFVNPGDDIHFSTRYDLASATVLFSWHNYTTGVVHSVGTGTINGHPVANYYDGRYADFIDEQVDGTYVRQYAGVPWHNAGVTRSNGAAILAFAMPHFGVYSIESNGTITQQMSPDSTSGGTSFNMGWDAC